MREIFIITLASLIYALVHSLLATHSAKNLAQQWWGPAAERWYRLTYNLFAGISFLPILWLLAILPDHTLYVIAWPWVSLTSLGQFAGVIIVLFGIWQTDAFAFLGLKQLSRPTPESEAQKPQLTITGLYRWMRHPLYTGGLLFIWCTPIMTRNSLTLTMIVSLYLIVGARFEERRLRAEFGEAYAQYQQTVPMLLPRCPRENR